MNEREYKAEIFELKAELSEAVDECEILRTRVRALEAQRSGLLQYIKEQAIEQQRLEGLRLAEAEGHWLDRLDKLVEEWKGAALLASQREPGEAMRPRGEKLCPHCWLKERTEGGTEDEG